MKATVFLHAAVSQPFDGRGALWILIFCGTLEIEYRTKMYKNIRILRKFSLSRFLVTHLSIFKSSTFNTSLFSPTEIVSNKGHYVE